MNTFTTKPRKHLWCLSNLTKIYLIFKVKLQPPYIPSITAYIINRPNNLENNTCICSTLSRHKISASTVGATAGSRLPLKMTNPSNQRRCKGLLIDNSYCILVFSTQRTLFRLTLQCTSEPDIDIMSITAEERDALKSMAVDAKELSYCMYEVVSVVSSWPTCHFSFFSTWT